MPRVGSGESAAFDYYGRDTTVAADPEAGSAARCPECDAPISGRFCARCGQRQPSERDHSLRRLLGEWLDLHPARVPLAATGNGKPGNDAKSS